MRILFVDQFSEPGGAQQCLRDLMPEVHRRGWRSRLMTPASGLPLRPCANGRKGAGDFVLYSVDLPRMAASIRLAVRDEQIDLVYVNGPRVLPATVGLPCPVIFHAHSRVIALYQRKLIAWSLRMTNATVIAISRFIARDYAGARVVYNGVADLDRGHRNFDRKPVRVGIIGRIAPEKGHLDFVRAARLVKDAQFFVYGEPLFADTAYDRAVRAMAEYAPVRFCGWTDDITGALENLDVLAVPSGPNEGATRVIPEAFSAGTPVVCYGSGGIPEIVEHGRTGLITETPDSESLARAISLTVEVPSLRARLSVEGRKEWERRFTLQQFQTAVCDRIAEHATRARRRGRSAPEYADGAWTARPEMTRPE